MLIFWTAPVPGYLRLHHCIDYIPKGNTNVVCICVIVKLFARHVYPYLIQPVIARVT